MWISTEKRGEKSDEIFMVHNLATYFEYIKFWLFHNQKKKNKNATNF